MAPYPNAPWSSSSSPPESSISAPPLHRHHPPTKLQSPRPSPSSNTTLPNPGGHTSVRSSPPGSIPICKFHDENTSLTPNAPPLIFGSLIKTYRTCDSAPFVFDLLIKACLQSKRIDQALEIVRLLRSKGIYSMISTCNSLIMSVSKHHGSVAGHEIYHDFFVSGGKFGDTKDARVKIVVSNNVHTYNIIMHAFYRDGLVENLERVWGKIRSSIIFCLENTATAFSWQLIAITKEWWKP